MSNWEQRIQLKDIMNQFDCSKEERQETIRITKMFSDRLKIYPDVKHFANSFSRIKSKQGFNNKLNELYDYCDAFRIWID